MILFLKFLLFVFICYSCYKIGYFSAQIPSFYDKYVEEKHKASLYKSFLTQIEKVLYDVKGYNVKDDLDIQQALSISQNVD